MKVYYECKLKHHEAEIKKQLVEQEKSINKLIFKCSDEIDIAYIEKLKLLQMNRQDHKIESLLSYISQKTEKVKSVLNLEEKVRQDMVKSIMPQKKSNFMNVRGPGRGSEMDEI